MGDRFGFSLPRHGVGREIRHPNSLSPAASVSSARAVVPNSVSIFAAESSAATVIRLRSWLQLALGFDQLPYNAPDVLVA